MPKITFQPADRSVEVAADTLLLDAVRQAGIEIGFPCGGEGRCGKCAVRVLTGRVETANVGVLTKQAVDEGWVLACSSRVSDSEISVEIPEQLGQEDVSVDEPEEYFSEMCQELFPEGWRPESITVKSCIDVPAPQLEDGLSDIDRLTRVLKQEWGDDEFIYPLSTIRSITDTLREKNGRVTITLVRESGRCRVIKVEAGDRADRHYGIAVDIGTTNVALQLVSLTDGRVIATRSSYNDQIKCGLDVISRINYARRPEHLEDLRGRVLKTLNMLLREVTGAHGIGSTEISGAFISGNTTMIHLLMGLKPEYIRLAPYTPTLLKTPDVAAAEIGLDINPESPVHISPGVGSYVGGDITAGLLCTDIAKGTDDINLFIDIGTNGELVLGGRDFLVTCACSAGPAFEGGGIENGMRASPGAIDSVEVDPDTGIAKYSTIGDAAPKGICGSGMIALLANLFLTGWIDPAGKLCRTRKSKAIGTEGRRAFYTIVPAGESATGKPITISELDIENIIRSKAAIFSAASLILKQVDMRFEDLANIYIAGGFGRSLDLEKAVVIGLVPDLPRDRFKYIGNSSLLGTYLTLVSKGYREKQIELAKRMTYLELNTSPIYMDQYTSALFLPHTDKTHFPSVSPLPCLPAFGGRGGAGGG